MQTPNDLELIHPHDFFTSRDSVVVPDTCFVLMPFKEELKPVYAVIKAALQKDGISCERSDTTTYTGAVLFHVMQNISGAEVIIADLTSRNANVFYELGLAHVRTKDVVLIARKPGDLPFNLGNMNCHFYQMDMAALEKHVRTAAAAIRARRIPTELKDPSERTLQIVERLRDLQRRSAAGAPIIRQLAALSSFSNVGPGDEDEPERRRYYEMLVQEREELIECVRSGAAVQVVMSPLVGRDSYNPPRWVRRMQQLLSFLRSEEDFMKRVDIALAPYATQNLLFIADEILFEGHKTTFLEGGFQLTSVYANRQQVISRSNIFGQLFASAIEYTRQLIKCSSDPTSRRLAIADYIQKKL